MHSFQIAKTRKIKLVLPTQSLAEFLVGYSPEQAKASLVKLGQLFALAPFDAKAAVVAADIMNQKNLVAAVKEEFQIGKQCIKADINVLASAIAFGATSLYSEDGPIRRLAGDRIFIRSLPENATQREFPDMPADGDISFDSGSGSSELFDF